jgi:hypothetical protein
MAPLCRLSSPGILLFSRQLSLKSLANLLSQYCIAPVSYSTEKSTIVNRSAQFAQNSNLSPGALAGVIVGSVACSIILVLLLRPLWNLRHIISPLATNSSLEASETSSNHYHAGGPLHRPPVAVEVGSPHRPPVAIEVGPPRRPPVAAVNGRPRRPPVAADARRPRRPPVAAS